MTDPDGSSPFVSLRHVGGHLHSRRVVTTFDRLSVRERLFRKYSWQCYGHRGENVSGLSRSGRIAMTAMNKEVNSTEIESFFT